MHKTYDLFKVKLFLDSVAQCHEEKTTDTRFKNIEQELKACLTPETALAEERASNENEIQQLEDSLSKIEVLHNELQNHPSVSSEKKQELKKRIESTKARLQHLKKE